MRFPDGSDALSACYPASRRPHKRRRRGAAAGLAIILAGVTCLAGAAGAEPLSAVEVNVLSPRVYAAAVDACAEGRHDEAIARVTRVVPVPGGPMIGRPLAPCALVATVAGLQGADNDYERLVTRYQAGDYEAAVAAVVAPNAFDRRDVNRATGLYDAVAARQMPDLVAARRLGAIAALHVEAWFKAMRGRAYQSARTHEYAFDKALAELDHLLQHRPYVIDTPMRTLVLETRAHQSAVLGDFDRTMVVIDDAERRRLVTGTIRLAQAAAAERWGTNAEAWADRTDGRETFSRWRTRHLAVARTAAADGVRLSPDDEALALRLARLQTLAPETHATGLAALERLAEAARLPEIRYLAALSMARDNEARRPAIAVQAYRQALSVAPAPSACAGLDALVLLGHAAEGCPVIGRAVLPDPWPDYLTGEPRRLDALVLRLRERASR